MLTAFTVWAVAGAAPALPCEWPSVATFRVGETKCSATLVHPEVIVTAAHCLEAGDTARVRFGEDFSPYEVRIDVSDCVVNERYFETRAPEDDYAACILTAPVDVPIVPIAMGCDTAGLTPGADAAIVGFGLPEVGGEFGRKHWALTQIADDPRSPGLVAVGDNEVNGCLGDSGGPGFVRLPDGTWRTFGVLVAGPDCGSGVSTYATLHDRAEWLEAQTGYDLTPCHDADGDWNPGDGCSSLAADPLDGSATWEDHCRQAPHAAAGPCPEGLSPPDSEPNPATGTTDTADQAPTDLPGPGASRCSVGADNEVPWALIAVLLLALGMGPKRR